MAITSQMNRTIDAISECLMSPGSEQIPATKPSESATASGGELGADRSFSLDTVKLPAGSPDPGWNRELRYPKE